MIRILTLVAMLALLVWSVVGILANTHPDRLKAAALGLLSGALIVAGLWMIVAP